MKILTKILSLIIMTGLFVSCASSPSLQKYYIDNESNENFVSFDIPASIIDLKESISKEDREILESFEKLNVLAFVKSESNAAQYKVESQKVKAIIKDSKYQELIRIKDKGRSFVLKYEGDESDTSVDEFVIYVAEKTKGFALIRVLGDNMEPEKMIKLMNQIKNLNSSEMKKLEGVFKNIGFS